MPTPPTPDTTLPDDATELRFLATLHALVPSLVPVQVVGVPMTLRLLAMTPRGRGLRAQVEDGDGQTWWVNLDAVEFAAGSVEAQVVGAYRAWLGYDEAAPEGLPRELPGVQLEEAAEAIRLELAEARATLEELDLDEVSEWIGDDDPWGSQRRYWPQDADDYEATLAELECVPPKIEELAAAGGPALAIGLLEDLFDVLGVARFDDFVPDQMTDLIASALGAWIRVAPTRLAPEAVFDRLSTLLEQLEAERMIDRLLNDLPPTLEVEAIAWLEARMADTGSWRFMVIAQLRRLRLQRGELALLVDRVALSLWGPEDVIAVVERLTEEGEVERALQLTDDWFALPVRPAGTNDVATARRGLLSKLGRGEQALAELWQDFEAEPTVRRFKELRDLGDAALLRRAVERVAGNLETLVEFAGAGLADERIADHITSANAHDLRAISSWTLQDAAPALEAAFPEAALAVYLALGWRHVDRAKAQYYDLAGDAFARARTLCAELGRGAEWAQVAGEVVAKHGRKHSFMKVFRPLVPKPG